MNEIVPELLHGLDPVAFARALGFEPDPKQEAVLRAETRRGLLNCSRQWGKSTVCALKAVPVRNACKHGSHRAAVRPPPFAAFLDEHERDLAPEGCAGKVFFARIVRAASNLRRLGVLEAESLAGFDPGQRQTDRNRRPPRPLLVAPPADDPPRHHGTPPPAVRPRRSRCHRPDRPLTPRPARRRCESCV